MTSVAPLFVDHSDLSTFSQAVSLNTDQLPSQQLDQQFWSTPARAPGSLIQETLEITLTSPRLVNLLSFDTARYPHTVSVEYFTDAGVWAPLTDNFTGAPVAVSVLQSVPARLPKATAVPGHLHPQHAYSGHWEAVSLALKPVSVQRFRLVLQRSVLGHGPLDAFGNAIPYSLAIANLVIGYRIASKDDVPRTALQVDSFTTRQSFATTDDLLGSSVDYSLRTNSAAQVVNNTDAQASLIWRCEPQPFPQAVVNFYADLRNQHGDGQVIDRIFIDPINNGAHISLYYANGTPVGGFDPVNDPLTATQATPTGTAKIVGGALSLGAYGENANVSIDNTTLGFDPSLPWWVGIRCQPNFNQGADSTEHPLFDCGVFRLSLTATGLVLYTSAGDIVELPMVWLGLNDLTLIASYDGTALRLRAISQMDDEVVEQPVSGAIIQATVPLLTLGSDLAATVFANVKLIDFVLKEEVLGSDDFLAAPDVYSTVAQFAADDTMSSENALLRLDPLSQMISSAYPSALFGGPASKYDQMVWTPIPRDYLMQRGWMYLPATKAKFIKLEFTNLQAEYRDIYVPTAQLVKTFPPEILQDYRNSQSGRDRPTLSSDLGLLTLASQTSSSPYNDYPIYISTGGTQKGYTNTETYVADDYTTGNRLYQSRGWSWGFQALHSPSSSPRWTRVSRHAYSTEVISPNTKIAYAVGLRRIQFARTVFTGQDDAAQYEDMLLDQTNIASSNWVYVPEFEALTSGDAAKAQATSTTFGSSRNLRGVQYAAQQSEPSQLLPDPDFADPQFRNWNFVGDAVAARSAVLTPLVGTVLPVTRSIVVGYWGDIHPLYPTWNDLVAAGVTYGQLTASVRTPQTEGGIASDPVPQPVGGRVYAAARVVASTDLVSPLWVQIIDSTTGNVLSEDSAVVKRDQVTEWYTAYTLGEGGVISSVTWGDLVGPPGQSYPALADSFARPNGTTLGVMDSGQQWIVGAGGSLTIASSQAKVTTLGQANYVDTSSPWGSLVVKLGNAITTPTASASVPLLELGGYRFMNDGRVVSTATTNATAPLFTPAANDTLRFDFMPTKAVPIARLPAGTNTLLQPYAVVIFRNNNWIATVLTGREFLTLRGLLGQVNQTFATFNWNPTYSELPVGSNVAHMPMPADGALSADGTYWQAASDNSQWYISGAYTFTTGVSYLGAIPLATPTAIGASTITRDYTDVFGTFVFNITQLAATVGTTTYMVAVLDVDFDNVVTTYLRADGAVVTIDVNNAVTVLKSGVVPSPAAGTITVRYVPTKILSSAFKTTYSIQTTDTKAMIFVQNGAVQGVVSGPDSLWVNTVRGIASYNDGSAHLTLHEGMAWSPDASQVALDTRARTWGDVDQNNTLTWGDLVAQQAVNTDPIEVRVVQKAASGDTWYMDTLSLFNDPIVWEFSNDGGLHWSVALDIRNNPKGVLIFPPPATGASNPNPPQNKLAWRVTAYGPGAWISHLVVRPWYQGLTRGVPARTAASQQGPNVNPYDHYPPIEQDPRFQVWNKPIPRSWWFTYRDHDPTHISDITTQWLTLLAGDALVLPETP